MGIGGGSKFGGLDIKVRAPAQSPSSKIFVLILLSSTARLLWQLAARLLAGDGCGSYEEATRAADSQHCHGSW